MKLRCRAQCNDNRKYDMTFELNGQQVRADSCPNHTTLLEFIRARGLTGAKEGCAEGECGACTVLFVRPHDSASKLVPVNSCLMLLPMTAGHEVYTVEALATAGRLAEVQQAMVDLGGSQCGYCTPGFILSMFAEQHRGGVGDPRSLGGNLCRCTGYRPISDALARVGPPTEGRFTRRLAQPTASLTAFESAEFARPCSLRHCLEILRDHPAARVVAGATDLAVESNLHGRRFEFLVSVEALAELRTVTEEEDEIVIGAGVPLSEIDAPPPIAEWLQLFASPLIRNRATLGGNLATASPIGDAAPLLLALDASVEIASLEGLRTVHVGDFFTGYRTTLLNHGELLISIRIPKPLPTRTRFYKVAKRRMDDISSLAGAFSLRTDADGTVRDARLAYGGVAATPTRVEAAEHELLGSPLCRASVERAKQAIAGTLQPISDHRASAAYRLAMAQRLLDKFLYEGQPR